MNCEDIAFNLMVANATGKPPIKVWQKNDFLVKTPLEDRIVIQLGQRKNKLTKQPTEITATGGSKEEVQMLNSKLWKCGDALQCCRYVHNF